METVKWIRLSTGLFDNRKIKAIEQLPDGDTIIVVWLKLLILAGEINDSGCVYFTKDIPFTESLLSTQFQRPLPVIQLALSTFQHFGMIEIVDDMIYVTNWERYQNAEGLEQIREKTRERVQRHREKKRLEAADGGCNVTVTLRNAIDKNREDKNREEKRRTIQTAIAELSVSESVKDALLAFSEMRNRIKRPLTERALNILLNKLNALSHDEDTQIAILNESILHGWQSVFALKQPIIKDDHTLDGIL